ncbi:MAG: hypothetical protein AAF614_22700 [Chloroflexota bacterium]
MNLGNDWLGFVLCTIYVLGMIALGEGLRRWLGYTSNFTRKVIHIGVGMVAWLLHFFFQLPWLFIICCGIFAVLTFLDWKYGLVEAMASGDESNLGTVYFPIMVAIVVYFFWDRPPLMVAALMPLTWGDGMAPVIGRRFGTLSYQILSTKRTLEGSLGFFLFAFVFTWLALWAVNGSPNISPIEALVPALVVTAVSTLVEAISVWGLDNITITIAAMLILNAWPF